MKSQRTTRQTVEERRGLFIEPLETRRVLAPVVIGVDLNSQQIDPPDLASGPQPTSWTQQRSEIRDITVNFDEAVNFAAHDLVLTNLGLNAPVDDDVVIPIEPEWLRGSGTDTLVVEFPHATGEFTLPNGVYSLEVLASVTNETGEQLDGDGNGSGGDSYFFTGDAENRFFRVHGDFNGDTGASIFDFPTFRYWFGQRVGPNGAPQYVDLNFDDGISIFDFEPFAANFGNSVEAFPAQYVVVKDLLDSDPPGSEYANVLDGSPGGLPVTSVSASMDTVAYVGYTSSIDGCLASVGWVGGFDVSGGGPNNSPSSPAFARGIFSHFHSLDGVLAEPGRSTVNETDGFGSESLAPIGQTTNGYNLYRFDYDLSRHQLPVVAGQTQYLGINLTPPTGTFAIHRSNDTGVSVGSQADYYYIFSITESPELFSDFVDQQSAGTQLATKIVVGPCT